MDSTLIQGEIIDEMAKRKGVEKEIAAITSLTMNGKNGFCHQPQKTYAEITRAFHQRPDKY